MADPREGNPCHSLCAKDGVHIHALMQDSDDLDVLATNLLVKNNMASLWKFSVAISDFITLPSVVSCLGTNPIAAEASRPVLNCLTVWLSLSSNQLICSSIYIVFVLA